MWTVVQSHVWILVLSVLWSPVASVNVECMNTCTCLLSVGSGQAETGTR